MKNLYKVLISTLFIATFVFATTINIPGDYPTIQAGIDAAIEGDTLVFDKNTNLKEFNFHGKRLIIKQILQATNEPIFFQYNGYQESERSNTRDDVTFTITQITNDDVSSVTSAPYSFKLDDDNKAHLIYKQNGILYYLNNVSGTFENPILIDAGDDSTGIGSYSILIDSNNYIHIIYCKITQLYDENWNLIFLSSHVLYTNNNSGTFSESISISDNSLNVTTVHSLNVCVLSLIINDNPVYT